MDGFASGIGHFLHLMIGGEVENQPVNDCRV
jgi:hypothetical protein